jgi:single-stranded-DNA-specific exonuclease
MKKYSVPDKKGNTLIEHLLASRGIEGEETKERFLNPNYNAHTHDPFLMKDMEKSVDRILRAIANNERVAIWSDYDADGIPGAVVLHDFFKKIGFSNFENYIPDRHEEGFGLNAEGVEEIASRGVKLLITIDCGIADYVEIAHANSLGMEVIITDHHLPNENIPQAYAILNPKQKDCSYPEKNLCGAGVVYKLIQALALKIKNCELKIPKTIFPDGYEKWFLDMVGLATLSDMVPLTGENRVFAYYGLKVLRKSPRAGLGALLRELRVERVGLNEDDIGFTITPRINAASRMGIPIDAFRLFTTTDLIEAGMLAEHLNKINNERKGKVASLVREVRKIVAEAHISRSPSVVVAGSPEWRPSLLGLVANTLVEDYGKPVFVWGREGSRTLKGSCRSDGSVDLSVLMQEAKDVFSDFGGHREAGGFSIELEKVHLLEMELERAYEKVRVSQLDVPKYSVDSVLSLDEMNWDLWSDIEKLSPFGVGNPKPLFLFEQIAVSAVEQFGKERQHLKLIFEKQNGEQISAVRFYSSHDDFGGISRGQKINLLANIERSVFRSVPELRLRIVDVV